MAYYKPQKPITKDGNYIYPLTTYDQIIMRDGNRWDGQGSYTPVKGVDYWTEADREEMVNDVLAALPNAEEASF